MIDTFKLYLNLSTALVSPAYLWKVSIDIASTLDLKPVLKEIDREKSDN